MSEELRPYRPERHEIGTARDSRRLALVPMTDAVADSLGAQIATFGPWAHYGFDGRQMAESLKGRAVVTYHIDCGGEVAGAVVISPLWLVGPYLRMLAILPRFQSAGIGARVLAWFEAEAPATVRSLWLCVSGFNVDAQRFYEAHGFRRVAVIDDMVRDGDDELLMRKRLK